MPPIWMPMEAKLAKPQRAYVVIRIDFGSAITPEVFSWPNEM
jgi:hypothetical protein